MQLKTSLATLTLMSGLAASYDTTPFVSPLASWEISTFTISLPPSDAGTDGYATIKLAISNPNEVSAGPAPHAAGGGYLPFAPSAANCTATGHNTPDAMAGSCAETTQDSYGVWEVSVVDNPQNPGPVNPNDINVKFTLTYNVTRWNAVWYKVYEASAHFALDDNLVVGACADHDNHCSYELDADKAPVLIDPVMTDCKGTCSNDP